jgi:hypothetical protein
MCDLRMKVCIGPPWQDSYQHSIAACGLRDHRRRRSASGLDSCRARFAGILDEHNVSSVRALAFG